MGYPKGIYRVGPLARLNNADACGTPYADVALAEFRMLQEQAPVASSFHYHYARLVEIIFALEMMERLLKDPDILDTRVRARARSNRDEGIGVSEAPRGTLMHHYRIDDDGLITWVNLIIATGHNNLAMNQAHPPGGGRLCGRQQPAGGHAQPRRGRDPLLRPLPLLRLPRLRRRCRWWSSSPMRAAASWTG